MPSSHYLFFALSSEASSAMCTETSSRWNIWLQILWCERVMILVTSYRSPGEGKARTGRKAWLGLDRRFIRAGFIYCNGNEGKSIWNEVCIFIIIRSIIPFSVWKTQRIILWWKMESTEILLIIEWHGHLKILFLCKYTHCVRCSQLQTRQLADTS